MGAGGVVALAEVWRMLDHCAPGYTRRETDHHWRVQFNGRTFAALPLGAHGRRKTPAVEVGHVRRMVRAFGITDCARGQIEGL